MSLDLRGPERLSGQEMVFELKEDNQETSGEKDQLCEDAEYFYYFVGIL